jgi:2-oxoglutarate ferredoxin oxidoreductase subunit gamma
MSQVEIKISGFGGQGVILAGYLVGQAAAVYDHHQATMVQSYGPEARGSACSAQVIISDQPIHYPYVTEPDVLIAMSQEAYSKFACELKSGGLLVVDEDLVTADSPRGDVLLYRIPATKIAEAVGHRIVANVVMLGFLTAVAQTVSVEAMREALASSLPASAVKLNEKAFDAGYERGQESQGSRRAEEQRSGGASARSTLVHAVHSEPRRALRNRRR